MFYGNCFEFFADFVEIIVCLRNIIEGRNYNDLNKINLEKYRTTDKANRLKALEKLNEIYGELNKFFNNSLRNASHHVNIEFDEEKNLVIYSHGKENIFKDNIPYIDYLKYCNGIFLNTCVLEMVSLVIFFNAVQNK